MYLKKTTTVPISVSSSEITLAKTVGASTKIIKLFLEKKQTLRITRFS